MTPQERKLVDELFDRLSRLEAAPREADAESAIADGLRRAPHAPYALVQTVLVQDEALKRANARIQELEGDMEERPQQGGFLDSMRDALLGSPPSRGSVPNVQPGNGGQRGPMWNSGQVLGQDPRVNDPRMNDPRANGDARQNGAFGGGGSFLGTAAAAAAGVIGGSMLMNSMRGMFGGGQQQGFGDTGSASKSPWDNASSSGDLARDAGVNDIGKGGGEQRQNFADNTSDQNYENDDDDDDYDSDDFDSGDSDFA